MTKSIKPGLVAADGAVKAAPQPSMTFTATVTLDAGSDSSDGKMRMKAGASKAYQSVVVGLGSGIVLRGQVYVPAKLLSEAARERARRNLDAAEQERDAEPTGRIADGSIG